MSTDVQTAIQTQFEETKLRLTKNPQEFDSWIRLGTLHKIAGDYKGAAEDWEYASQLFPTSSVSFNNLGDLYLHFLQDYAKAEIDYKKAIVLSPHVVDYYRTLFFMYRDIYKDKAKALGVVDQGLKANPNNNDLLVLKGQIDLQP